MSYLFGMFFFPTGTACRLKVLRSLKKEFNTVDDAETAFGISYFDDSTPPCCGDLDDSSLSRPLPAQVIDFVITNFGMLSDIQRVQLVSHLLRMVIEINYGKEMLHFIPNDLLSLLLPAMEHLFKKGKENTIYHLCKSLGEKRDRHSARLNVDKMPFGLIAYNCKFFASESTNNIRASEDYKQWLESMYCYFGNAWASLFLGPMW